MNVWWCNQSKCWGVENKAKLVIASANVKNKQYREMVNNVRAGNITVHYVRPNLLAFSRALSDGFYSPQLPEIGPESYGAGWMFHAEYHFLTPPIHRDVFRAPLLQLISRGRPKHFPITRQGNVLMGYFFPFSLEGLKVISECHQNEQLGMLIKSLT